MEQVRNEQTIYSAAVYCRLSKDDEQAGESVSIETQKMMLTDFCHERGFSIYEIYVDDGYSGLNFNRPAFTRLLEDIDSGKRQGSTMYPAVITILRSVGLLTQTI